METETVIAASWLNSGWIDVGMIVGWMAFVVLVGVRVWRAGGEPAPPPSGRAGGGPTQRGRRRRGR